MCMSATTISHPLNLWQPTCFVQKCQSLDIAAGFLLFNRNHTAPEPTIMPNAATVATQTSIKQGVKSYRKGLNGPQPSSLPHSGCLTVNEPVWKMTFWRRSPSSWTFMTATYNVTTSDNEVILPLSFSIMYGSVCNAVRRRGLPPWFGLSSNVDIGPAAVGIVSCVVLVGSAFGSGAAALSRRISSHANAGSIWGEKGNRQKCCPFVSRISWQATGGSACLFPGKKV